MISFDHEKHVPYNDTLVCIPIAYFLTLKICRGKPAPEGQGRPEKTKTRPSAAARSEACRAAARRRWEKIKD